MLWIGTLVIAPLWGILSTQLLLQAWLSFINGIINIIAFFAGRVDRKSTALGFGVCIGSCALFNGLFYAGFWLLSDILHFGYSASENTVYWIFAVLSGLYMLPQIPERIRQSWRNSMEKSII